MNQSEITRKYNENFFHDKRCIVKHRTKERENFGTLSHVYETAWHGGFRAEETDKGSSSTGQGR